MGDAGESELTAKAREVLAGLSDHQRGAMAGDDPPSGMRRIGMAEMAWGYRLATLKALARFELIELHDHDRESGMWWSDWTDLGREVSRLLALEVDRGR